MKLVLDIETQNSFQEAGSRQDMSLLKVSVAACYWYQDDKYYVFFEDELDSLKNLISQAEYIIGFNTIGFDLPILQQYMKDLNLLNKKQIDMMLILEDILGYKIPLQAVAQATLGKHKISHGLEAINMWKQGRLDELKEYCQDDVRLTREIYEYGIKHNKIKFNAGWLNYDVPVSWPG